MNYDALVEGMRTKTFGRQLYLFRETDSTNELARRFAYHGEPEGTLLVADYQRAGRGKRGRSWFAPPGSSILASIVLRPPDGGRTLPTTSSFEFAHQAWYTLLTALAIVQGIERETGLNAQVKWPNDVWLADRKIGGILTEYATDKEDQPFYIVGFGINVNLSKEALPLPVRSTATSLSLALGYEVSRERLLQQILLEMETRVQSFRTEGVVSLKHELQARSLVLRRWVRVDTPEGLIEGEAVGFDEDGSLIVRGTDHSVSWIRTGDLSLAGIRFSRTPSQPVLDSETNA